MRTSVLRLGGAMLLGGVLLWSAASVAAEAPKDDATVIAEQLPTYPLQTCVVSGEKLGGEMGKPVNYVHQGHLVRFCCKGCIKQFNADPARFLKLIDDAAAKGAAAPKDAKEGSGHSGGGCCGGGGCSR